jgi:hypothetical protein
VYASKTASRLKLTSGGNAYFFSGEGMVMFNRPRDLLKILLPFSRPARRARCSSGESFASSWQIGLQQFSNFSAQLLH